MRLSPLAAAIIGTGCGSIVVCAPAAAQASRDADRETETLLVVEQAPRDSASLKFTAPLIDTPQTVSVIPQEIFNAQGARSLTDVLKNTPGISFSAGENGFSSDNNNFSLRGFGTSGNIFVDGVRDSGSYGRDVFNVERVEVVKGPAADNGRGSAGGYINIVTKTPQRTSFARGTASLGFDGGSGTDERLRTTFDINQPLGGAAAVRVNLLLQDGGVAGRRHAREDVRGLAPSIAFGLDSDTRFTAALQHVDRDALPDWGVPAAMIEGMMRYDAAAAQANRKSFFGLDSDYDDTRSTALLGRFEHDFGSNLRLVNVTRVTETERSSAFTVPTGYDAGTQLVTTQRQFYDRENNAVANQTGITARLGSGGAMHTLAAGVELAREESESLRFGTDSSAGTTSIFAPDPYRASPAFLAASQAATVEIDTIALYAYDTIELSSDWEITAGLRLESYDAQIGSMTLPSGAPQGPDGYRLDDTTLSGKVGVVYKPAANGSVYASFGVSTLPPGSFLSNPDISRAGNNAFPGMLGQNNENAKTQRSENFEIGTKWELFDMRFSTTAAVFHTERRNVAISGKTPGDPASPTVLMGYGKQLVEGIEIGLSGAVTESWSLFAGLLLMDSERRHSEFLDAARREANPNDYGSVLRTSGDQLAFTPRRSANLWTTYSFPFGLTIGAGAQYVGDSYAGRPDDADRIIPNGAFGKLPSYTVLNALVSFEATDRWFVRLNIDNVSDELYATSSNWPAQRVLLGPPRSYAVSADFRF